MKALLIILLIFPFQMNISQKGQRAPAVEICTRTYNFDSTTKIRFNIEPMGSAWNLNPSTLIYYIDTSADSSNENMTGTDTLSSKGFDVAYNNDGWGKFWLAVNKVTIFVEEDQEDEEERTYFYIDHRDCNYGRTQGSCSNDLVIKYDENDSTLYYAPGLTYNYQSFQEADVLNWSAINSCSTYCTSDLPNFWQNSLIMVNENNHPYLIWGPHPTMSATSYKLYRSVTSNPNWKYTVIATTNDTTFYYLDNNTSYWHQEGRHYYVKAYNGSYSAATNTVSTPVNKMPKSAEEDYSLDLNNFQLKQNHPNPFNPSTNITYQLPKKGHVALKVYNTLGKEVAELVNEIKEEGVYSVTFNGDNLPSGMYFYKIQSDEFVDVKKMLLLK